jgi:K+-sensing histidine kinase KdpD
MAASPALKSKPAELGSTPNARARVPNFQDQVEPYRSVLDDHVLAALARKRSRLMRGVRANAIPVLASLGFVGLATAGLAAIDYFAAKYIVPINLIPLAYLLPVVVAATRWGIVAAVVAAVAGTAAADFFFYPPLFSFWLDNPQDAVDLLLFLVVAIVISDLAARLRRETDSLRRHEAEIQHLYVFSQRLANCFTSADLFLATQDYFSNTLGYPAFLIPTSPHGEIDGLSEPSRVPGWVRQNAAELIAANEPHTRLILDETGRDAWLVSVVSPETSSYGAIAIDLGRSHDAEIGSVGRIDAMLEQTAKTLKHLKIAEAVEHAKLKYQADLLRDALVGGVSHELRTPLTSITGSASVLAQMSAIQNDRQLRGLVEAIRDQASQLDTDILNLLDATRITANGVSPRLEWTDPADIVHAAVNQKGRRLAEHPVHLAITPNLPLLRVDCVLVEQALGQLLDNAAKYSPAGSPVTVSAHSEQDQIVLSVKDEGAGLTSDEKDQFGRRSFRSQRLAAGSTGSGLGLWVASTFVAANGGTLDVMSQGPDRGTTVTIRLPVRSADVRVLAEAVDD